MGHVLHVRQATGAARHAGDDAGVGGWVAGCVVGGCRVVSGVRVGCVFAVFVWVGGVGGCGCRCVYLCVCACGVGFCVCVCVCVCACVRASVRACVRASVQASVCVCVGGRAGRSCCVQLLLPLCYHVQIPNVLPPGNEIDTIISYLKFHLDQNKRQTKSA